MQKSRTHAQTAVGELTHDAALHDEVADETAGPQRTTSACGAENGARSLKTSATQSVIVSVSGPPHSIAIENTIGLTAPPGARRRAGSGPRGLSGHRPVNRNRASRATRVFGGRSSIRQ